MTRVVKPLYALGIPGSSGTNSSDYLDFAVSYSIYGFHVDQINEHHKVDTLIRDCGNCLSILRIVDEMR